MIDQIVDPLVLEKAKPVIDINDLITSTPGVVGGRPRIAGTRITVRLIVGWHKAGWSPEKIVSEYTHLKLGQVYAALTYYYANQEVMDAQFATEEAEEERLEKEWGEAKRQAKGRS